MAINPTRRTREVYLITVKHGNTTNVVEMPDGATAEYTAHRLQEMIRTHESLVKGTVIIDIGKPVYRMWRLWGSGHADDTEFA